MRTTRKIRRAAVCAAFLAASFAIFPAAHAEIKTVTGTGTYQVGDGVEESIPIAQQRAIERATRNASEKAGVYVESFSAESQGVITQDELKIIAATVLEVRESKVKLEVVAGGQALRYRANVVAVVDTDNISKFLKRPENDRDAIIRMHQEMEEEAAKIGAEIETLKKQYHKADEEEQRRINEEVKRNERMFQAEQCYEEAIRCLGRQDGQGAIEQFRKAIEIAPENEHVDTLWGRLGTTYYEMGDYDASMKAFEAALKRNPGNEEWKQWIEIVKAKSNL